MSEIGKGLEIGSLLYDEVERIELLIGVEVEGVVFCRRLV